MDKVSPDLLSLLLFRSHPIHENPLGLYAGTRHTQLLPRHPFQSRVLLLLDSTQSREFLLASKGAFNFMILMFFFSL